MLRKPPELTMWLWLAAVGETEASIEASIEASGSVESVPPVESSGASSRRAVHLRVVPLRVRAAGRAAAEVRAVSSSA